MFRKISNKSLSVIFIILLVIVAVLYFTEAGKKERTFREELVDIDSSAVTKIVIISKANNFKPFEIFRDDNGWHVELKNGELAPVSDEKIGYTLKELMEVKPKRLAARGENKWAEFQVDSSGTRVQVFEGEDKTLDIILGRFSYQAQPKSISTYVRLTNDVDVYEVDGFLSFTFNQGPDAFRDPTIVKSDFNKWERLEFNYPADSSFTLVKTNGKWFIDGIETDSAKTISYLRKLANYSRNKFADNVKLAGNESPSYVLTINEEDSGQITLKAYVDDKGKYLVTTTENPETRFDGTTFVKDLFVGKSSFFK